MQQSLYEQLGGERKLRAVIDAFVDRMRGDLLIGFFFVDVDAVRLKRLGFEHAAAFLGAPVRYSGRALPRAHAPRRITGGHFARRRTLLQQTLEHFAVPAAVAGAWLRHQDRLRPQVVRPARPGAAG